MPPTLPSGPAQTSRTIDFVRFVSIYLVAMVHVPQMKALPADQPASVADLARIFLVDGLGRISAPLLGLVSGYFALELLDRIGVGDFVRKKLGSLFLPLIVWNLAAVLLIWTLFLASGRESYLQAVVPLVPGRLLGLTHVPYNVPLHFLADLLKCNLLLLGLYAALAPLSAATRRRVYFGLGVGFWLLLVWAASWMGAAVGADRPAAPRYLVRPDLIFFFFIGAGIACGGPALVQIGAGMLGWFRPRILLPAGLIFVVALLCREQAPPGPAPLQAAGLAAVELAQRMAGVVVLFALIFHLATRLRLPAVPRQLTFRMFCSHGLLYAVLVPVVSRLGFSPRTDADDALLAVLCFPALGYAAVWLSFEIERPLRRRIALLQAMLQTRLRRDS